MHILHLLDPPDQLGSMDERPHQASSRSRRRLDAPIGCPEGLLRAAANIQAQSPEHKQTFCLVGPSPLGESTRDDQPAWDVKICPPLNAPELAAPSLGRMRAGLDPVDVVQCWSIRTLRLAKLAFGRKTRCTVVLADLPVLSGGSGLVHRAVLRDTNVVVLCDADRDSLGDVMGADFLNQVQVAPVPVARQEQNPEVRAAIRSDLQLADHEVAILIAGDPLTTIDVRRIEFLLSSCVTMGLHPIALIPRGVPRIEAFRQHLRRSGRLDVVRFVQSPTSALVQAADLALLASGTFRDRSSRGLGALSIATAHAHGVPCIAPASVAPDSLYPDEDARACLAFNASLPEIARIMARLVDDDALRNRAAQSVKRSFESSDRIQVFTQAVSWAWESSSDQDRLEPCPV